MKKTLLFVALLCMGLVNLYAQDSQGGTPLSFRMTNISNDIDLVNVQQPDVAKLLTEDMDRAQKSEPYRIGVTVPVNININNSGTWTDLPEMDASLWRLTIKSDGAKSIGFGYGSFYMPEGAKLFLYNKTHSMVIGAYTSLNNTDDKYFSNQRVYGDEITLELLLPNSKKNLAQLNITELNYFYRNGENEMVSSEACEVNVNCAPEGTGWQLEKKGVCKMDIKVGTGWFNCSGTLVNNAFMNCTPYVLLADHCHYNNGYASAADYNAWIFYFHYEATTCTGTTSSGTLSKTGCTLKAHDTYGQTQNTGSDFCLVQINSAIATSYNVYYNGWDRTNTASASGVSIHHPSGDIMKISTYNTALTSVSVGGTGTHWQVTWAATTNGHGVTEPGSSGSPIFNTSGKVVGTLTGGNSFCTAPNDPDYYGKLYYHWDKNGSTAATRLKDWLDPTNTGITSMAGLAACYTGIPENKLTEEKAFIYPSPAQNEISVDLNSTDQIIDNLRIYNLMGELVKNSTALNVESSKITINISNLPDGVYFLTAQNGKTIYKGEFVKIK